MTISGKYFWTRCLWKYFIHFSSEAVEKEAEMDKVKIQIWELREKQELREHWRGTWQSALKQKWFHQEKKDPPRWGKAFYQFAWHRNLQYF